MGNYLLEDVQPFNARLAAGKTFLVVHKLHRTPYHVGLLHKGTYHSLTIKGYEHAVEQEVVEQLSDTTYNNLVVELKLPFSDLNAAPFFSRHELNAIEFRSCLFPIREFLAAITANNKFSAANNLFELLDLLQSHSLAGVLMATRMSPVMEGKIVLERYTMEAIQKHIKRLKELNQREKDQTDMG